MVKVNPFYSKLPGSYLFAQIAKKTADFKVANPGFKIHRLGIGNTTEPLTPTVLKGLREGVRKLGKMLRLILDMEKKEEIKD